ncbi:MAG: sodium-dependent transporter [Methylococcaceae bacterium]
MTDTKTIARNQWSSRLAFILAATGSAVGLGNIWKFPYITGENGGGAFVLIYLLCVALIGIPLMMAETLLGRRVGRNPIETMRQLTSEVNAHPYWRYLGWLGVLAGLLILSYYSVIAGWASAYTLKAFFGSFFGADAQATKTLFSDFVGSPIKLAFWHTAFMLVTMLIVERGVNKGLEKFALLFMPLLFVLMLFLVGYAMTTSYYQQGLDFLFTPDFSKISGRMILTAMGQAFFSLGLSCGTIMIYGAYLPKNVSIMQTSVWIAVADTVIALLAGIAIFPLVFMHGLHPASGPGLVFETLPIAFGNMTGGWLFGVFFFVMLVFAALTSSIALIEPAVAYLIENKNLERKQACIYAGLVTWLIGLGTVFSFNTGANFKLFGLTFFAFIDYITANLMLPIGGFGIAVFTGWYLYQHISQDELALPEQYYKIWQALMRYIVPATLFLVFLHTVGVL